MLTKNPRINVVFERPLYQSVRRLAQRDGVSLSFKIRDLVKWSLEYLEDILLTQIAEERTKTFDRRKALSHKQIST
ncbi:MAG: antitoxin, RHH family protein [Planctomycetota bacterium]